jgi:Skp family chaperone for outer membrane proteins
VRSCKTWVSVALTAALSAGAPLGAAAAPAAKSQPATAPSPVAPPSAAQPPTAKPGLCMLYLDALVGGSADAKAASLKRGLYDQARDAISAVYRDRGCTALLDASLVLAPVTTLNITDEARQRQDALPDPTPPVPPPAGGPPNFRTLLAALNVVHGGDAALAKACGLDGITILQHSKTVTYIDQRIAALKAQATAEVAAAGAPIQVEADALLDGQGKMSAADYQTRTAALRERMKAQRALMSDRQSQIRALESDAFGRFQVQLDAAVQAQIVEHNCDPLVDLKSLGPFPPERDLTPPVLAVLDAQFVAFPIELPAPGAAEPHS